VRALCVSQQQHSPFMKGPHFPHISSAGTMQAPPQTPTALTPQTSTRGQGTMDAVAGSSSGVVLSETQLGNMALRAKQQRFKAEQDRQLLQVLALPYLRNARSELI